MLDTYNRTDMLYILTTIMTNRIATQEMIKNALIEKGADFVGLFGSFARGEERLDSDIDILVHFTNPISLFDHAGIVLDLEEKIGRRIDLVTEPSLSKFIRPYIMKDLKTLYER
jgi:predicted nucleotidyltransferase